MRTSRGAGAENCSSFCLGEDGQMHGEGAVRLRLVQSGADCMTGVRWSQVPRAATTYGATGLPRSLPAWSGRSRCWPVAPASRRTCCRGCVQRCWPPRAGTRREGLTPCQPRQPAGLPTEALRAKAYCFPAPRRRWPPSPEGGSGASSRRNRREQSGPALRCTCRRAHRCAETCTTSSFWLSRHPWTRPCRPP